MHHVMVAQLIGRERLIIFKHVAAKDDPLAHWRHVGEWMREALELRDLYRRRQAH